jgi:glycosyltransferase involved in cell wall biosynthesis
MRTVLLLAPYFPPIGGAGVQRNVQLVRGLPGHGFEPVVITGPGAPDYRWTPADTSTSGEGIDPAIHRLPGPEPPHGVRWEGRAERWLRVGTRWERWWFANATRVAASLPADIDLVHAALRPYSTARTAHEVARQLGRPLVVDLEDPWALDEMLVYPTGGHRALEARAMHRALSGADAIIMNTREAARRVVQAFPELGRARVEGIPNAFDAADFAPSVAARTDGRFRIVHTGSMHTELGLRQRSAGRARLALGGHVRGVDFLPRSYVFLVEALERLLQARPDLRDVVEVHFAGVLTSDERAARGRCPYVRLHGFLSHPDTIALLRSADLLFLPMQDLPPGTRATIVPHKTYEYIASGRRILAAVPDGDARDLLEASGTAELCRPADVTAMSRIVEAELDRWRAGQEPLPDPEVVQRCEARRLVADVARVYEHLLARRSG